MYEWYSQLTINIKWRGCYSKEVDVNIGTRQGELSLPLLFNIFCQDLIDKLSSQHCGILSISMESYNVFCYADDLILTSLTVTGLQSLIDVSRDYITSHGLNFNSSKTTCSTFGTTYQVVKPTRILNGMKLKQDNVMLSHILELVCQTMHVIISTTESQLQGMHFMVSKVRDYVRKVPFPLLLHTFIRRLFSQF